VEGGKQSVERRKKRLSILFYETKSATPDQAELINLPFNK
jgi:hypothetical protein